MILIAFRIRVCGACFALCAIGALPAAGQLHATENIGRPGTRLQHDPRYDDSSGIRQLIRDSIHLEQSSSEAALAFYENILVQSRSIGYNKGIGLAWYGIGQIFFNRSMYPRAFQAYLAAAAVFRENKLEKELGGAYNNIANIYKIQGYTQPAAYYYYLAARLAYAGRDTAPVPTIYYNLGLLFPYTGQGFYYLNKAGYLAKKHRKYETLGLVLLTKGEMLAKQQKWEPALALLDKAILLGNTRRLPTILYKGYLHYASLYNRKEEPERAFDYAVRARKLKDSLSLHFQNEKFWLGIHDLLMGNILTKLGRYREAQVYLERGLETAAALHIQQQISEAHKTLSLNYEYTGNYKKALEHQRIYKEMEDTMKQEAILRSINDLEVRYRTAEKDREIALKEQEIRERNMLIGGISVGTVLLLAGSLAYYRHARQKQKLLRQEQELIQLKAVMEGEEIERGRIARELHDGIMVSFSSVKMNLSAIMKRFPETAQTAALDEVVRQLDDATRELRKSAHNLMPDMLLREGLVAAVQYFCNSLSRHDGPEITFQRYGPPPSMPAEYELMLYRIIQELLQNALKYAEAGRIIVQLDHTGGLFTITVEDNGKGFDKAHLRSSNGSGLSSIRSRIGAAGGVMEIQTAENAGTTVYIEIETVSLQPAKNTAHAHNSSHRG